MRADLFIKATIVLCGIQAMFYTPCPIIFFCTQIFGLTVRKIAEPLLFGPNDNFDSYAPPLALLVSKGSGYYLCVLTQYYSYAKNTSPKMHYLFIYFCILPFRVVLTSEWTLYLPFTTAICMANVLQQPSVKKKYLVMGSNIACSLYFVWMHYENFAPWFLALQLVWSQLLLYCGFLVTSVHYSLAIEQQEQTRAKLQKMNESKSKLLSTIGHEIRTPLTAVIGTIQICFTILRECRGHIATRRHSNGNKKFCTYYNIQRLFLVGMCKRYAKFCRHGKYITKTRQDCVYSL